MFECKYLIACSCLFGGFVTICLIKSFAIAVILLLYFNQQTPIYINFHVFLLRRTRRRNKNTFNYESSVSRCAAAKQASSCSHSTRDILKSFSWMLSLRVTKREREIEGVSEGRKKNDSSIQRNFLLHR